MTEERKTGEEYILGVVKDASKMLQANRADSRGS